MHTGKVKEIRTRVLLGSDYPEIYSKYLQTHCGLLQEVCYESSLGKGLVRSKGRRRPEFWFCDSLRNIKTMDDPSAVRDR